jgi:predicted nucleic-acid-binding Zn-ribbon protein
MGIKINKQLPNIPAIDSCIKCGSSAKLIDWDFRDMWAVMCDKCGYSNSECINQHRAVSRWNRLRQHNE